MLELLGAHKDSPSLDTMAVPRLKLVNRLKSAAYNALQWQSGFLPSTMGGEQWTGKNIKMQKLQKCTATTSPSKLYKSGLVQNNNTQKNNAGACKKK